MKSINLYALANEMNFDPSRSGEIRVPFGRWDFGAKKLDDGRNVFFVQELTKDGAERMAAKINAGVANGEKGVPVYWGHPDVPELAHKYPDKRAKGWIKSAAVEAGALILRVEWLEDNATDGFGWFSPYWGGPATDLGQGRYLKHLDSLTSVALINIPNIQEFRLANERGEDLAQRRRDAEFKLPPQVVELAKRFDERVRLANEANYDESKHPRAEDGKWTSGGGSGGGGSSYGEKLVATRQAAVDAAQKTFDEAKSVLIAGQKRGWSKEEDDKAFKAYDRAERKLKVAKSELRTAIGAPSISHEEQVRRDAKSVFRGTATKAARDRYMSELAARFDEPTAALANSIDANGMGHSDENGQFDGSGSGGGSGGSAQSSRLDRMLGDARVGVAKAKAKADAAKKSRIAASRKYGSELEARLKQIREKRLALKKFNDKMAARLKGQ